MLVDINKQTHTEFRIEFFFIVKKIYFHSRQYSSSMLSILSSFLISDFRRDLNIENVLLGISPASICSWPTFRNPVSVPSSKAYI